MKKASRFTVFILALALLTAVFAGCGKKEEKAAALPDFGSMEAQASSLYVKKVEGLSQDFMMGADISSVIALEESGVKYSDWDGNEADIFDILSQAGINTIRVRVWNDPYDENGKGYGGGNCDIDKAAAIGKRASAHGMSVMIDFHYSDFWADPSKQMAPKAWKGMSVQDRTDALYEYTKASLLKLKDAGVNVAAVQIGNETTSGMSGVTNSWTRTCKMFNAGSKAVREVLPEAKVVLHFTNPNHNDLPEKAASLAKNDVDYDIFASSYYPEYHGTIDNLMAQLGEIKAAYGKDVMIAETAWGFTMEDGDGFGNSFGGNGDGGFMISEQGQANLIETLIRELSGIGGLGVFYWEPAWVPVGNVSGLDGQAREDRYAQNVKSWEEQGTGWATSYAAGYDPDDAGKWYGGCSCDNMALFDFNGKALESLRTFGLVRCGTTTEPSVQNIEDITLVVQKNTSFTLPEKVTALMTDMTTFECPVTWDEKQASEVDISKAGDYTVNGTTGDGGQARLTVQVKTLNILSSPGFEDDNACWSIVSEASDSQIDSETPLTGSKCFHFWDAAGSDFTISQTVTIPASGTYRLTASLQGGETGKCNEAYIFFKAEDSESRADFEKPMLGWKQWDSAEIRGIELTEGTVVTVGAYVSFGSGGWGTMDDFELSME